MKRLFIAALFLFSGPPAWAGTFNLKATLEVPLFLESPLQLSGSATGVTSIGGGVAQVPGGLFQSQISTPISPPQSGLNKLTITNFGLPAGTLDAAQPLNQLGLQGTVNIFAGANLGGSWTLGPIGSGGTSTSLILGIFPLVLSAEAWQIGTFVISGPLGTQTLVGIDARTPAGEGLVQFVAPGTFSDALGIIGGGAAFPAGSTLTLRYVAVGEPVVWALLTGALCVIGRRRR